MPLTGQPYMSLGPGLVRRPNCRDGSPVVLPPVLGENLSKRIYLVNDLMNIVRKVVGADPHPLDLRLPLRPLFLKRPTSSSFLVSTLITRAPPSWWSRACSLR